MSEGAPGNDLEVLFDTETLDRRIAELGRQISADYRGRPLRLVGILKGSWGFMASLARRLELEVTVDFLGVASYERSTEPTGAVRITKDLDHSIEGLDVLVVEDILDTGRTFEYILGVLSAHRPRSLKTVALLDKPSRRVRPVKADYVGFTVPDVFVVGYGLDYAQRFRHLPDVRILRNV